MSQSPIEVVQSILGEPTNREHVRGLVHPDATYVSLNYDNPDLHRIMPWAGRQRGPDAIVDTYSEVGRRWGNEGFDIENIFASDENVAVFGRFAYRAHTTGKLVTSPFSIFAKVTDGKVSYMQFMEDTFASSASFRTGGTWRFRSDPNGDEVSIGES